MPIGVRLIDLRRDLRAETGQSLNPAQGVQAQASQDNQLNRQQMELWDAWRWPHLRYWIDVPVSAGQNVYDYPEEMPFDQIQRIYLRDSTGQLGPPLAYGLHAFDVSPNVQPGTPVRWGNKVAVVNGKTDPAGKMQISPSPVSSGIMCFEGQAPVNPLVADDDECVIDSKAIVLFAAAEILAFQKVEAAALKLTKAQNYLRKLLINCGADKRTNYNMGGRKHSTGIDHFGARPYRGLVPGIDYVP
jgi:hypothetical protein